MTLSAVALFFTLFHLVSVNGEFGEICVAYDGTPGQCIYLRSCSKLVGMAKAPDAVNITHSMAMFILKRSTCGFIQSAPLVCCSVSSILQVNSKTGKSMHDPIYGASNGNGNSQFSSVGPFLTTMLMTNLPVHPPMGKLNQISIEPALKPDVPPVTTESSAQPKSLTTHNQINEKLKLLPDDCGRVLTFNFFRGNDTDLNDFPWTSLLEYNTPNGKRTSCGGALINNRYILTAAHCVRCHYPTWKLTSVLLGEHNTATDIDCLPNGDPNNTQYCAHSPVSIAVEEEIVHPRFLSDDRNHSNDIALLRLAEPVNFTDYIQPICLPFKEPQRQKYLVSGWGKSCYNNGTDVKFMSSLTLDNQQSCADKYKTVGVTIDDSQICAGIKEDENPCVSDIGGPLMGIEERDDQKKRSAIFGVLSMTNTVTNLCQTNWPGIYIKVQSYLPWILRQLRE